MKEVVHKRFRLIGVALAVAGCGASLVGSACMMEVGSDEQWADEQAGEEGTVATTEEALVNGAIVPDDRFLSGIVLWTETDGTHCSATRVGPRHILTAAHCVVDTITLADRTKLMKSTIRPGYQTGRLLRYSNKHTIPTVASAYYSGRIASTVVHPGWALACASGCASGRAQYESFPDLAFITLQEDMDSRVGIAKIDTSSLSPGDVVSVTGYGCEANDLALPNPRHFKAMETTVASLAQARQGAPVASIANEGLFALNYALTRGASFGWNSSDQYAGGCPGDSGGPLYRGFARPGQDYVVAVNAVVDFDSAKVSQLNYHARLENGADAFSPTILWLKTLVSPSLASTMFAAAPHPTARRSPSVTWTYVGHPSAARHIAACENGYLYALNDDKSLYVNKANGADTGWKYLDTPTYADTITCANTTLYAFNTDRTLWRFNPNNYWNKWTYVETMDDARAVAGNRERIFAINANGTRTTTTDDTAWSKPKGGYWTKMGGWDKGGSISAGVDVDVFSGDVLSRVFITTNGVLYMNSANGAPGYWVIIDRPWDALEVAAAGPKVLYALNGYKTKNYALYRGIINQ